jgi:hypothetical protein
MESAALSSSFFARGMSMGRPLLPHDAARTVGQAGDNAVNTAMGVGKPPNQRVGTLEKAEKAKQELVRAARSAFARDPALLKGVAAAEKAGDAAIAAVARGGE